MMASSFRIRWMVMRDAARGSRLPLKLLGFASAVTCLAAVDQRTRGTYVEEEEEEGFQEKRRLWMVPWPAMTSSVLAASASSSSSVTKGNVKDSHSGGALKTPTFTKQPTRDFLRIEFEPGKASLLGEGTFGTVRKAKETTTGRTVALKIIGKNSKSLVHEIGALKKVRDMGGHPNVVALLGVVKMENDPARFGLVFELLEGGELYESLVKNGAYSESSASAVIRQIASALAFLHEDCRIAHADLKPENLLLRTKDGQQVAICDFGSAVELDDNGTFELSANRLLGTVAYAAPELLTPYAPVVNRPTTSVLKRIAKAARPTPTEDETVVERASSAVDVWSLGCILYVVLSGMHPFDPDNELTTDEELAKSILKGHFDFSAPAWRDVSSSAKDLIKRMLERDPAKRISARQVLEHDWVRLPQRKEIISGSDVRLIGFLRTQKRLQDHVFHLMLDGSLKSMPARHSTPSSDATSSSTQASLEKLYRTIDVEGKGFITRRDLERSLAGQALGVAAPEEEESQAMEEDDDKLYYSSLNGLLGCGERVTFQPGEVVFRQGDQADSFYFIDRGKVEILLWERNGTPSTQNNQENKEDAGKMAAVIGAGDFFGETALIKNQPRNATVRAGPKGAELIRFSRDDFDRLVSGSSSTFKMLDEHVKRRTIEHVKFVFSSMFHDNRAVHLGQGGVLLKRGEPSDSMYYISEGVVDVLSASGEVIAQRKEGETVGELGLVTGEPRSMDIVCSSKNGCAFKKLDKDDLQRLLNFSPLARAELTNALSARGGITLKPREESQKEVDIRRRWTLVQGIARQSPSTSRPEASTKTEKVK